MVFQGLATFKNTLQPKTKPTIERLRKADFKLGVVSGDNIYTTIAVGRESGIISQNEQVWIYSFREGKLWRVNFESGETVEVRPQEMGGPMKQQRTLNKTHVPSYAGAITGETFLQVVQSLGILEGADVDLADPWLREIALNCRVFSRMSADQKGLVINVAKIFYNELDISVGYCGDGANDCVALKEADVGISLADTQDSLHAPFISRTGNIECVETISLHGKCALATYFDVFKFFSLYSTVQGVGIIVDYAFESDFSMGIYLAMDVVFGLNIAITIGFLGPVKDGLKFLPKSTILNWELLVSYLWNVIIFTGLFIGAGHYAGIDANYKTPEVLIRAAQDEQKTGNTPTYEGTVSAILTSSSRSWPWAHY